MWHSWGGEYLLYNDASGSTHLLDEMAANLIQSLEGQAQTIRQMAKHLEKHTGGTLSPEEIARLEETLQQFKRLGLAITLPHENS